MKNLLFSLFILCLPVLSLADSPVRPFGPGALRAAVDVENALNLFAADAMEHGDRAAAQQDYRLTQQLDGLSDEANTLGRFVRRQIVRALKNGTPEHHVAGSVPEVEQYLYQLERSLQLLPYPFPSLRGHYQRIGTEVAQLNRELQHQPMPLTASCSVKTGGNFFTPKSHVECTVYGRGAVGYEAHIGGQIVHGQLQPLQPTQTFVSEKVKVGYEPAFQVYLVTRNGDRILVAQN